MATIEAGPYRAILARGPTSVGAHVLRCETIIVERSNAFRPPRIYALQPAEEFDWKLRKRDASATAIVVRAITRTDIQQLMM